MLSWGSQITQFHRSTRIFPQWIRLPLFIRPRYLVFCSLFRIWYVTHINSYMPWNIPTYVRTYSTTYRLATVGYDDCEPGRDSQSVLCHAKRRHSSFWPFLGPLFNGTTFLSEKISLNECSSFSFMDFKALSLFPSLCVSALWGIFRLLWVSWTFLRWLNNSVIKMRERDV